MRKVAGISARYQAQKIPSIYIIPKQENQDRCETYQFENKYSCKKTQQVKKSYQEKPANQLHVTDRTHKFELIITGFLEIQFKWSGYMKAICYNNCRVIIT